MFFNEKKILIILCAVIGGLFWFGIRGASAVTWLTPAEITPGSASAWTDADVSGTVPAGATGVILHVVNTHAIGDYALGFRKNGSTDNRTSVLQDLQHTWVAIGVDTNRILELYVGDTTYLDIYLVGYFTSEATFFDNATDKSLGVTGWADIDISSDTGANTAIGAIFEISHATGGWRWYGLRKNGSTDDFSGGALDTRSHNGGMIGVDNSEILEGNIENTDVDFFLVGYMTSGAVFNTNATLITPGSAGSWLDLTTLPAGATGGIFETLGITTYDYGLRKNGSAEAILQAYPHGFAMVEADASRIIEGYVESLTYNILYLVGYTTSLNAAPTVVTVSDAPDMAGVGTKVSFTVDWNDEDSGTMALVRICQGSGITTSTATCKDGTWAGSDGYTNRDPESVSYTTVAADKDNIRNYWAFACDNNGTVACSDGTAGTFTVANQVPDAPDRLLVEGMEVGNVSNITDATPEFKAIYKDSIDEGDVGEKYCVEVDTAANFSGTQMWASDSADCYAGTAIGSNVAESTFSPEFNYGGTALTLNGATYYWRMWFWDGEERSATSTTGWFKMANSASGAGVRLQGGRLKGGVRLK